MDYKQDVKQEGTEKSVLLTKLIVPIFIIVIGLALISVAFFKSIKGNTQSNLFLMGAISITAIGVIALLYVLELINKYLHLGLTFILLVTSLVMLYFSKVSLDKGIKARKDMNLYTKMNIQKLEDLRLIQTKYKLINGVFAPTLEELENFLLNGKVMNVEKNFEGTPYENGGTYEDRKLTDEEVLKLGYDRLNKEDNKKIMDGIGLDEALILGYVKLDTVFEDVLPTLFDLDKNSKKNIDRKYIFDPKTFTYKFTLDNSLEKFAYEYKVTEIDSLNKESAFRIYDANPFDPYDGAIFIEPLYLGDVTTGEINGSWEED